MIARKRIALLLLTLTVCLSAVAPAQAGSDGFPSGRKGTTSYPRR